LSVEISRAEAAEASIALELSSEVSSIIANTDLTAIDSFAEVVANMSSEIVRAESVEAILAADLSSEVSRAESAELSIATDFANIYVKKNAVVGVANGTLKAFTFANAVRVNSEALYLNGILQSVGDDYTVTTNVSGLITGIEFIVAPDVDSSVKSYGVY
jgi:hypothetical protein